jgi:hypothetical protein
MFPRSHKEIIIVSSPGVGNILGLMPQGEPTLWGLACIHEGYSMLYFLIDETLANFIKSKQRGPKSKPKGQKSKGSHNGPKEQIKFQSNINSKKHIREGK